VTSPAAALGLALMLALTVGVGVYARRFARTTSDFMVAARAVPPSMNAAAISGEYLSAASFLGVAGLVMQFGWDVLWYPVCYAAGYLVLLIFIAGPLRRFGAYTIPDFAEGRFDSPRFRRLAVGLVIVVGFFYTLPQMKAAGITLDASVGVPYPAGVAIVAGVVVSIVVAGGMRGITFVQALQFAVKLFAISLPVFVLLAHVGLPSALFEQLERTQQPRVTHVQWLSVHAGTQWTLAEPVTVHLDRPVAVRELPAHLDSAASRYAFVGVAPPPSPDQYAVSPTELDGDVTLPAGRLVWAGDAKARLSPGGPVPFASGTPPSTSAQWLAPFGPLAGGSQQRLLFTYSLIIAIVFGTMGLPHILVRFYTNPNASAARRTAWLTLLLVSLFYLWPPVYGLIGRLQAPELYASGLTDTVVLVLPRQLQPAWAGSLLSGVVAAGAFAAFTSTLSGLLVSLAGALGHDVYGRWLHPDASPRARSRAFRVSAVVVGASAAALGLLVANFDISVLVGWAFAIAASSFFPLLVLGIWWRGLTTLGAALGAAVGGLAATAGILLTMVSLVDQPLAGFLGRHSALAVILAQPAIVTIPVAFAVMVGVSILRPRLPGEVGVKMLQLHIPDRLGLRRDYIPD
jgi:cation/acetate symporter